MCRNRGELELKSQVSVNVRVRDMPGRKLDMHGGSIMYVLFCFAQRTPDQNGRLLGTESWMVGGGGHGGATLSPPGERALWTWTMSCCSIPTRHPNGPILIHRLLLVHVSGNSLLVLLCRSSVSMNASWLHHRIRAWIVDWTDSCVNLKPPFLSLSVVAQCRRANYSPRVQGRLSLVQSCHRLIRSPSASQWRHPPRYRGKRALSPIEPRTIAAPSSVVGCSSLRSTGSAASKTPEGGDGVNWELLVSLLNSLRYRLSTVWGNRGLAAMVKTRGKLELEDARTVLRTK